MFGCILFEQRAGAGGGKGSGSGGQGGAPLAGHRKGCRRGTRAASLPGRHAPAWWASVTDLMRSGLSCCGVTINLHTTHRGAANFT